jgi:mannosyltransferase OCH1-like enzyme
VEYGKTWKKVQVQYMIPKIIHQVWLGSSMKPIGLMQTWIKHNPDYTYMLWTDSNVPKLINQATYNWCRSYTMKSDILRYELLMRYGGIYADCDLLCLQNMDLLLLSLKQDCFMPQDSYWWKRKKYVCNNFMGAIPWHPFIIKLVKGIRGITFNSPKAHGALTTGPKYCTDTLLTQGLSRSEPSNLDKTEIDILPWQTYEQELNAMHKNECAVLHINTLHDYNKELYEQSLYQKNLVLTQL